MKRVTIVFLFTLAILSFTLNATVKNYNKYGISITYDDSIWTIKDSTEQNYNQIQLSSQKFSTIMIQIFNQSIEPDKVLNSIVNSFKKRFQNIQVQDSSGTVFGKIGKAKDFIITKNNLVLKGKDIVVQEGNKTYNVYYQYLENYSSQELPNINNVITSLKLSEKLSEGFGQGFPGSSSGGFPQFGGESSQQKSGGSSSGGFVFPGQQSGAGSSFPSQDNTFQSGVRAYNTSYFSFNYPETWTVKEDTSQGKVGAVCTDPKGTEVFIYFLLANINPGSILEQYKKNIQTKLPQVTPQSTTFNLNGEVVPALMFQYNDPVGGKVTTMVWAKSYGQNTLFMGYIYTGDTKDNGIDVIVNSFKIK